MYIIGCVFMAVFGFVYFAMLDTMVPALIFIAVALSLIPVMTMYGPEAALIAEAFTPRLRYSGASLGYQLASIIAGGPAPFIATWLFATYHSTMPIGIYVASARSSALRRPRCCPTTPTRRSRPRRNTKPRNKIQCHSRARPSGREPSNTGFGRLLSALAARRHRLCSWVPGLLLRSIPG